LEPSFIAIVQECAKGVPAEIMAAIASVESGLNPYAIRMNSSARGNAELSRQPTTKQEAVAKAKALSLAGHDLDLGLMGLPAASFGAYGITIEQAFDACTSLRVAATRLKMLTKAAEMRGMPKSKADEDALAAYFGGGDAEPGREAGYPARVTRARAILAGRLATLTISPSERPLPARQGPSSSELDGAAAALVDPEPGQTKPSAVRRVGASPAESPSWDVYASTQQRGTTLLVYSRPERQ
jgi:type IV secretion system protein VirB1